jgi:hypothetical protein
MYVEGRLLYTEGGGIPAALGPDPGAGIAHSGLPS